MTELGLAATAEDRTTREAAIRRAVLTPTTFAKFYNDYNNNKIPPADMLRKILATNYEVPEAATAECATLIVANGERVGIVRPISGSKHVLLNAEAVDGGAQPEDQEPDLPLIAPEAGVVGEGSQGPDVPALPSADTPFTPPLVRHNAIFIGHGKKKGPLEKLSKVLDQFKIPYVVATTEPNLGRPIPVKVRETMLRCGSAILIFTRDEKFTSEDGREIWRPSENVVHELGAASFQYEDRVVIFKERGIDLPTNFSNIGYIEFEEDAIEAKTAELLGELIGFGLVKITPA